MTGYQLNKILFLIIYWITAVVFYVFMEMAIEIYIVSFYNIENYEYNLDRVLIIGVLVTFVASVLISSFEVLFFNKILRKKALGIELLIKTLFYFFSIFFFTTLATYISLSFSLDKPFFHHEVFENMLIYFSSGKVWMLLIYWFLAVISGIFILQVSEKLGRGVLFNYLIGKYHNPKEEIRVFMFLDLTSSSSYAEKLGHLKYSQLLQDCFYDLTDVINKFNVQIYQYVGDEVVLTWQKDKGIGNYNCINAFFAFEKAIKEKSEYYRNKFGIVPEFKAGINSGFVTIAEVGVMKKELAYHGDAINTASHIRSVCGKYQKKLLVSADLLSLLPPLDENYKIEFIGVHQLKGKKNVIGLFSIEKKNDRTMTIG